MTYSTERTVTDVFFFSRLGLIIVNTMLSYIVKHTHIQQSCVLTSTKYIFKHILCVLYSVIIIKFTCARPLHDHRDCYGNAHKEQNLPLKDFSRACIGIIVATIGENVSHTGQNSLLPMRLFIPNPSFRTSFRSLTTCRAAQIHTFHSVAPMVVPTNLRIGMEHRKLDWEHQLRGMCKNVE